MHTLDYLYKIRQQHKNESTTINHNSDYLWLGKMEKDLKGNTR